MKETVVVSLGGSVLYSGEKFDSAKAKMLCGVFNKAAKRFRLVVVTGGGPLARRKVEEIRKKGGSEFHADTVAIQATRDNAKKVVRLLKNGFFIKRFSQTPALLAKGKIVVSGGMIPGITTDSVSVLFAELVGAKRVVNVSNVDGIYDSDPRKNPSAKKFSSLSHEKLVAMASKADSRKARVNFVFDLVASKLAARSRIPLFFVSSASAALEKALAGLKTNGTMVWHNQP